MSLDLSWLWNAISGVISTIQNFFASIWQQVQNIVNAGQGIFAGLAAFGSAIWDAIVRGATTFGEWISNAFNWIYQGLRDWAEKFGQWLWNGLTWIASGFQWIGTQLYNFGQWIWSGLVWIYDQVRNIFIGVWNWLCSVFGGLIQAAVNWWNATVTSINRWFTNLLKVFRQKIVTTVMANISIAGMWRSAERIINPGSLKDIGYGMLGMLMSPIVGYSVGKFIDIIVPMPSTPEFPLIPTAPEISYTPPSVVIERPAPAPEPDKGVPVPPMPPTYGLPLDSSFAMPKLTYTLRVDPPTEPAAALPPVICSAAVDTSDASITFASLSYEVEVG